MKKSYKLIAMFAVLLCMVSLKVNAQALAGVYTINGANATTWPGGNNFQTFSAFAATVIANGVSGPVDVNVANATYNEQVTFNTIPGTSAINKITINGNGALLTFNATASTAAWTMGFGGADRIKVSNLQIQGTGGTYAYPLMMWGGSDYNTFSACTFSCNANQGTGTGQMPVVVSGANNTYASAANSGSYNLWENCDMFGGYYGICFYGPTAPPYNTGNQIIGCKVRDFYYMGTYLYYHDRLTIKNNTVERLTRTTFQTACYGIYCVITTGTIIEGNKVHKLFNMGQTNTSTTYGIMMQGNTSSAYTGDGNIIRNNIVGDINFNGTIYCIYAYYTKGSIDHNTISMDHTAATSGSTYGLFLVTTTGFPNSAANNLISITRGGTGSKYGIYYSSTALNSSNNNDIWVNSAGGNNYAGYYSGNQVTLANLQTASGQEASSYSINPVFANIATGDLHPTSVPLNNLAQPLGVIFDQENAIRNQTTPDIGALEFLTPVCSGAPASNTVTVPNYAICPGEDVSLALAYLNPLSGFTYAWNSSTVSNVGPFNPVPGANSLFYTAPSVTVNTYYSVVMTCTAPGGTSIQPVGYVQVAGPTNSTVPAYEDFEQVGKPNRLPNCSWSASGMGSQNLTSPAAMSGNRIAKSGTSFGYFSNATTGTSYFYTNKIQMNTGITYSAAIWYATEYFGYNNWSNLSIMVGPNQSSVGMVQVASVGPAVSGPYKLLNGLFTVPTAGDYYVAIRATSSSGNAFYLMIDDLSITIPCEPGGVNTSTVTASASSESICLGDQLSVSAVGADTYTWSTGDQTNSVFNLSPTSNTTYVVYGQNAITGCISTQSINITVNNPPSMIIMAVSPMICQGQQAVLTAFGSPNLIWNPGGSTSQNIVVSPNVTTSYTVSGTAANGCVGDYVQTVTVNPSPVVSATSSNPDACKDDMLQLTASGNGVSFQWISNTSPSIYQGNPLNIQAQSSSIFTVIATSSLNCTGTAMVNQNISDCTGLTSHNANQNGVAVYPNPTTGALTVIVHSSADKTVNVTDVTGRVIFAAKTQDEMVGVDLTTFAAGVYYVSVKTENHTEVIKVIKN